jgi:hypothetical protein
MRSKLIWSLVIGSLLAVGVPLAAKWARQSDRARCALDGHRIHPVYQVRLVDSAGQSHRFCCMVCAQLWIKREGKEPAAAYVTDEVSGTEINADDAFFVRSTVITNHVTGNNVHVFMHRTQAEKHARLYQGCLLGGDERLHDQSPSRRLYGVELIMK